MFQMKDLKKNSMRCRENGIRGMRKSSSAANEIFYGSFNLFCIFTNSDEMHSIHCTAQWAHYSQSPSIVFFSHFLWIIYLPFPMSSGFICFIYSLIWSLNLLESELAALSLQKKWHSEKKESCEMVIFWNKIRLTLNNK